MTQGLRRCRLLAPAQIGGALCAPGHEFFLAPGAAGPRRAVVHAHEKLDVANDAARLLPDLIDEPLYEEWDGERWTRPAAAEVTP